MKFGYVLRKICTIFLQEFDFIGKVISSKIIISKKIMLMTNCLDQMPWKCKNFDVWYYFKKINLIFEIKLTVKQIRYQS